MTDSWIHATAGTETARNTPTAQMRQTPACTPATNVPSASRINRVRLVALSFTMPRTSGRNISHIAATKASQCSACVATSCMRSAPVSSLPQPETMLISP